MDKQLSLVIKGIAIIMMIVLHINITDIDMSEITSNCVTLMRHICVPVPLFLLLSGYGLSYSVDSSYMGGYRVGKLIVNYWVACFPFIILYSVLDDPVISFDTTSVICNVIAFHTTWNFACWFIFPYSLLVLLVPLFRNIICVINKYVLLILLLLLYFSSGFLISRYNINYQNTDYLIYNAVYFVFMLLPFVFGMIAYQTSLFDKLKNISAFHKSIIVIFFVFFTLFQVITSSTAFNYLYAICIVITANFINCLKCSKILSFLGVHSMNIWLIHAFFLRGVLSKFTYLTNSFTIVLLSILLIGVCYSLIIQIIQKWIIKYYTRCYYVYFHKDT